MTTSLGRQPDRRVLPCTNPLTGLDLVEPRANYDAVTRLSDAVVPQGVTFVDLVTLPDPCHVGISYSLDDRSLRWVRWYEDVDVLTSPVTPATNVAVDAPHGSCLLAGGRVMLVWPTRNGAVQCAVATDGRNLTFGAATTIASGLTPGVCSQLRTGPRRQGAPNEWTDGRAWLRLVGGNPAVAYQRTTTVTAFARNAAPDGSGLWVAQDLPATTAASTVRSLADAVAGRPAVVRMGDAVGDAAVYSRATTASGVGGAWTNWV